MKPSITITSSVPSRLLNPASGYLKGYTHTLNPYGGCTFACSYCYVREMPVGKFRGEAWGSWVHIKLEAAERLERELRLAGRKGPLQIFMSSSTDPYQPVEYRTGLTRSLLEVMAASDNPAFLLVQTRSPLVTRDLDLLRSLGSRVRVSLTIETDLEPVRRAFTPSAPPLAARLKALKELVAAGIPAQAAVSPVLPSSPRLADVLASTGVTRLCVDDVFMGDGSQGKRTQRLGLHKLYEALQLEEWNRPDAYLRVIETLKTRFPEESIRISQEGFLP
ncbi:Radical SAM domain-containing protein [Paenibacillus mucilaginosus 3016]|uniref:Radical SAM domain-containing protein n=1 Tax=Paenibacillus mucilaginosus 3016 TaxID=1116391 RepID=H6NSC0_9BACL|nr:radical SAM protein [Paenibacillus mucilaginosus]AFC27414.1 Radical SAM domain-containing protein [Paenibacillus mucilaginosus 3016]WFA16321.1 radical SAM protein [Paenibacillus mucilaginosus]